MNTIIRLVTVSLMITSLVFGIAGYTGARYGTVSFNLAVEELEESGYAIVREIRNIAGAAASPGAVNPYCGLVCFPLPIDCATETLRPF
jgi:hypothetical protein